MSEFVYQIEVVTIALNCHMDSNDVVLPNIQDQIADWFENSEITEVSTCSVLQDSSEFHKNS